MNNEIRFAGKHKAKGKAICKKNKKLNSVVINFEISGLKSNILFLKVVFKCEQDNKSLSKKTTTTHKDP